MTGEPMQTIPNGYLQHFGTANTDAIKEPFFYFLKPLQYRIVIESYIRNQVSDGTQVLQSQLAGTNQQFATVYGQNAFPAHGPFPNKG